MISGIFLVKLVKAKQGLVYDKESKGTKNLNRHEKQMTVLKVSKE